MIKKIAGSVCVACLILTWGCQQKKKGAFSVSGTFKNGDKLASVEGPISKVYLIEVSSKDQNPVVLDSAKLPHGSGTFSVSGLTRGEALYELVFGENIITVPLINDVSDVRVNVDLGKKDDFYEVKGSDASSQLKDLITAFGKKNYEVEKTMADLDSLKGANAADSLLIAGTNRKNDAIRDLNSYLKQFLNTNTNGTISGLALSWASRSFSRSEFETSLNDMVSKFPDNTLLAGIKKSYDKQIAAMQGQDNEMNSWVGKQAPELSLPDVNGKPVSLDSYKGKYLLVDFWASWCGPCRAENPNVVSIYNQFKGKNFAILGVSLDRERDAWQEAIRADHLDWTHVSDLKFWSSKAVETFKFNGIPFNVLIDPQGKIIAQGLRGDDLEKELRSVLN
ncbi:MAG TPA: TlpA disulfide reductase family protein [Puia sp.]|uniref:TlpA disulfide reductase family protein n=1 Tax=Puia sp. TaxID=2045100 RepID=UPI002C40B374|nr:TlpA disulfide reductase family protein [Puia sp.]HVU98983.1 TlpA disulfide reductase family protein [Puia sp.]